MTFVEILRSTAINAASNGHNLTFEERKAKVLNDKFIELTEKYHPLIRDALMRAAEEGQTVQFMNFDRRYFKTKFPGLTPVKVARLWLLEMTNPESYYVPERHILVDSEHGKPSIEVYQDHFEGLRFEILNKEITIKFSW